MIDLKQELLCEAVEEMQPLLELHYQELTCHKDQIKLEPDWKRYAELEQQGVFVLFTAREHGHLVGYSAFFLTPHIHYAQTRVAINDVLFLHPDHRKGRTGIKLIRHSEQALKAMGMQKITWHIKFSHDWRTILHRMGYLDEEVSVGKML